VPITLQMLTLMSKYRLFMGYQRIQSATLVTIAKIQCNSPIP